MSELTVIFDGTCRCGQPAMFKTSGDVLVCLGCMTCPAAGSRIGGIGGYGPGYAWQGRWTGTSIPAGACRHLCSTGNSCTLDTPHVGLHEAWVSQSHASRGEPCYAWDDTGKLLFSEGNWLESVPARASGAGGWHPVWRSGTAYATAANRCGQTCEGHRCTRKVGHYEGWHEAWSTTYSRNPVFAWSPDGHEVWRSI